ncbi:VOC family protein [Estrella lausannensis]|uniref:3-demethylubiquinone-9 3-methyltransferase n=1 Tax=Estrella lausannensis TaxID=483423 RepID=A0A0H5DPG4_9BACT|nr:VOC family protein [Estrella lausannensis]CRX38451.1 3-demethylubiquinone-9 3-methyltransferase [Estrella lausannensis]
MQKIVPHLWFDKEAVEAAKFYTAVFPECEINYQTVIKNTPSGDCEIVSFKIKGYEFMSLSAGPLFKFNPSISFMVNIDPSKSKSAKKNLDTLWESLSEGGKTLMPLGKYPFSDRYGWVEDQFGVSWQLILTDAKGEGRPFIVPTFLFVGEVCGRAEEAMAFYRSVFSRSKQGVVVHYSEGSEPDVEGSVKYCDFMLENQWFAAMDSAQEHKFGFNEAISFIVHCRNQQEIDYHWAKLSFDPQAERCGWLKDKFGVSWQIVPANMRELMEKNPRKTTPAMLKMKRIIIKDLEMAGRG